MNIISVVVAIIYTGIAILIESLCYDKEILYMAVWTK